MNSCGQLPGWDMGGCCDSCHEDYEDYDYDLIKFVLDGRQFLICCKASHWAREHFTYNDQLQQWQTRR